MRGLTGTHPPPPAPADAAGDLLAGAFEQHAPALHRYLAARVGRDAAAELVADTFARAFRERARFDPERGTLRGWLYGIAENGLRTHRRSEHRRLRALGRLEAEWTPAYATAEPAGTYCWSHWVEFYPQLQWLEQPYAGRAQGVAMRYGITTHDMDYERARVRRLEELAAAWAAPDAGPVTLADLPPGDEDEGIEVIDLIEALVDNRNEVHVVNAPNDGAIPNLPDAAIVEVNAHVNAYGIRPIHAGPLPEPLAAHLRRVVAFQEQVVEAALSGDRDAALHAFLLEPTIQARLDLDGTRALLDELLAANAEHLPLFAPS